MLLSLPYESILLIYIISHCYIGHYGDCCFERGGDRIHQKYFQCRGTEQELSQCDSYDMTLQPRHRYVAEIYCNGTYMEMIQLGFIIYLQPLD